MNKTKQIKRMFDYLAMVTKRGTTSRALTQKTRATSATGSENDEITVRCWTPTRIRIGSQDSA